MIVSFTRRAEKKYHKIKDSVETEWGSAVAEAFEQKTKSFLDILKEFPEMGQMEKRDKQIRGFQLTKLTRVFYRIKGSKIIILTFFDVRQNPKKKPS